MHFQLYTKDNCPWCDRAKQLMKEKGFTYTELIYNTDYTREDLQKKLPNINRLTVPQIFINNEHIGGYENLVEFLKDGNVEQG